MYMYYVCIIVYECMYMYADICIVCMRACIILVVSSSFDGSRCILQALPPSLPPSLHPSIHPALPLSMIHLRRVSRSKPQVTLHNFSSTLQSSMGIICQYVFTVRGARSLSGPILAIVWGHQYLGPVVRQYLAPRHLNQASPDRKWRRRLSSAIRVHSKTL